MESIEIEIISSVCTRLLRKFLNSPDIPAPLKIFRYLFFFIYLFLTLKIFSFFSIFFFYIYKLNYRENLNPFQLFIWNCARSILLYPKVFILSNRMVIVLWFKLFVMAVFHCKQLVWNGELELRYLSWAMWFGTGKSNSRNFFKYHFFLWILLKFYIN